MPPKRSKKPKLAGREDSQEPADAKPTRAESTGVVPTIEEPTDTEPAGEDVSNDGGPSEFDKLVTVVADLANARDEAIKQRADQAISQEYLKRAAVAQGAHLDLAEVPEGARHGEFRWLDDDIDQALANALPLQSCTPLEVTIAREEKRFTIDKISAREMPITVYYPGPINPTRRPEGPGEFRYVTQESRELARINVGGQTDFEGNHDPTAEDIFNHRDRLRRGEIVREIDLTTGIDILWCPSGGTAPPREPSPSPPRSPSPSPSIPGGHIDPDTGLEHNPKNDGNPDHDQTGRPDTARYMTRRINGARVTVDRSRAQANVVEPHKFLIVNSKGVWRRWGHADALDWTSKPEVEKLNKWREQEFKRAGWEKKRKEARSSYTPEQRRWLFDKYVKPYEGARLTDTTTQDITDAFNDRFGQPHREKTGITSLLDRMRNNDYKEYGMLKMDWVKKQEKEKNGKKKDAKKDKKRKREDSDDSEDSEAEEKSDDQEVEEEHDQE